MDKNPEIKFLHYRYSDESGVFARGGMTIAFREIGDGIIQHATAMCHINDNFRKDLGRIKSAARLDSQQARIFNGTEASMLDSIDEDVSFLNQANHYTHGMVMARKFNGKRKGNNAPKGTDANPLTYADALADLAGTPRPA